MKCRFVDRENVAKCGGEFTNAASAMRSIDQPTAGRGNVSDPKLIKSVVLKSRFTKLLTQRSALIDVQQCAFYRVHVVAIPI